MSKRWIRAAATLASGGALVTGALLSGGVAPAAGPSIDCARRRPHAAPGGLDLSCPETARGV